MLLSILFASYAWAGNPFRAEVQPLQMQVGKTESLTLILVVPEGYHLYQDMLTVDPNGVDGLQFMKPNLPLGKWIKDPANPEQLREVFDETVHVTIPVKATSAGIFTSEVTVQFQGCKATLCYMPKKEQVTGMIVVSENKP